MLFKRLTGSMISMLYRQLAVMLASGVSVQEAMKILGEDNENRKIARVTCSINESLGQGLSASESFAKHPAVFGQAVIDGFKSEKGGSELAQMLYTLADETDKAAEMKARIVAVMILPVATLAVAAAVLMMVSVFVIPVFAEMYASFGSALPAPTQFVINAGFFITDYIVLLVIAFFGLVILFKKKRGFRYRFLALLPVAGNLVKKMSLQQFTRYLSMMLSFDLPLKDALKYAATDNPLYAEKIKQIGAEVSGPGQLKDAMKAAAIFPNMALQMVAVGDKSGSFDYVLTQLANFYEKDVDRQLSRLVYILDILLILLVGLVVGIIVIALYLPIFRMAGAIG